MAIVRQSFFRNRMAYIKGIASISSQRSFGNLPFERIVLPSSGRLDCIEPDYTDLIDARAIRRMSKIIRMGVATAALALKEAGIEKPEAIITGTGLGCVTDTTQFLTKLIENKEEALNPTPFIQSTHNTIASQIALLLQCLGYNQTYSQRGFSFENGLQDAMMMIAENPAQRILVGGIDEATNVSTEFLNNIDYSGVTHGEGAAFVVLGSSPEGAWAEIAGMRSMYKPKASSEVSSQLSELLKSVQINANDIDLILLGRCGNDKYDWLMNEVAVSLSKPTFAFKGLCGEYSTASSFAMWLASMTIKKGFVPGQSEKRGTRNVLIYNHYFNQHHSVILLKAC